MIEQVAVIASGKQTRIARSSIALTASESVNLAILIENFRADIDSVHKTSVLLCMSIGLAQINRRAAEPRLGLTVFAVAIRVTRSSSSY